MQVKFASKIFFVPTPAHLSFGLTGGKILSSSFFGLSSSNFWSNRLSEDKVHLIRKLIESKVSELYVKETAEVIKKYEQSKTGTL